MRKDEFELTDSSYSEIEVYINYTMKEHEILSINPPIHI